MPISLPIRVFIADDEPLARERLRALLGQDERFAVIGEASDGKAALDAIPESSPDLLFLDIQMPEMTGVELLASLLQIMESPPVVVFVTAYDHFALQAFDLHAVDYLLKPFDKARFKSAIEKAMIQLEQRSSKALDHRLASLLASLSPEKSYQDRLSIKSDGRIVLLPVDEIDWIGAASNYAEVHAGKARHLMRETMSALEERLDPRRFLRISRSTIVAIGRIREIQPLFHGEHAIILADGTKLTASRGYKDALKPFLGK